MELEAVIFDWGGTLTPWHVVSTGDAWAAAVGSGPDAERLARAEDAAWLRSRDEHTSATLDQIQTDAGVQLTTDQLRTYFDWWEEHTLTDPQVQPLFAALAERGLKIGILSNTTWPRERHEGFFARDGVLDLIDAGVYTSEIAWTKPHPEAFRAAMAAVGVTDPQRAVFVGDRPFDDIYGATSVGMRAVLVPHSVIPTWQTTDAVGTPDAIIEELSDLVAHVDAWHRAER